jgi:DNA-binding MarR family transcriptional regulator
MPRKEFVQLMEENIYILDKLGDRLKTEHGLVSEYSRQQLAAVLRLRMGGPAKLKNIARREGITAPNLCATFRKLESERLVERRVDENDRRNTWYSVTAAGEKLSDRVLEKFREGVETLFALISKEDEARLTGAMKTMNEILKKMEYANA